MQRQFIAVDFDGTCVTNEYPNIGEPLPHAIRILKRLTSNGHQIILNTMRDKKKLDAAEQWFHDNDIPLYAVGRHPRQLAWTRSYKTHADFYIDDKNICMRTRLYDGKKIIDWLWVEKYMRWAKLL